MESGRLYFEKMAFALSTLLISTLAISPLLSFFTGAPIMTLFFSMALLGLVLLMVANRAHMAPALSIHFYVALGILIGLIVWWSVQYSWVFALFGDSFSIDGGAALLMCLGFFIVAHIGKPTVALRAGAQGLLTGCALLAAGTALVLFFGEDASYTLSHVFIISVGGMISSILLIGLGGTIRMLSMFCLGSTVLFAALSHEEIVLGAVVVSLITALSLDAVWARAHRAERRVSSFVNSIAALALVVCAGSFFIGGQHDARISDMRPSLISSLQTLSSESNQNPAVLFLGAGPTAFTRLWDYNRVGAANAVEQWNSEVPVGFNNFVTLTATIGLPLAIGILLAGALLIVTPLSFLITRTAIPREHFFYALCFLFTGVYMYASMFVYAFDFYVVALASLIIGFTARFQTQKGFQHVYQRAIVGGIAMLFLSFGALGVYTTVLHEKGVNLISENPHNTGRAISVLYAAHRVLPLPIFSRTIAASHEKNADALMHDSFIDPENGKKQALTELDLAISYANEAVKYGPVSHQNYIAVAHATLLSALLSGDTSAFDEAVVYYQYARAYAKRHPFPAFLEGQAHFLAGDMHAAEEVLIEAIRLRPQYTEAQALLKKAQAQAP